MQKRNEYAVGEVIENDVGYTVSVGKPYADGTATAETGDKGVEAVFPILPDAYTDSAEGNRDYLVTMEINSEVVAYRELATSSDFELVLDVYNSKITIDFVSGDSFDAFNADEENPAINEGDEIRLLIEPVNIKMSPAFRAAVKKAYVTTEPVG